MKLLILAIILANLIGCAGRSIKDDNVRYLGAEQYKQERQNHWNEHWRNP